MRRLFFLLVSVALLATACSTSSTVLGEPTTELARVDTDTDLVVVEPTSIVDPDWAEPAQPVATAEPDPTPAPTAAPEPTATPAIEAQATAVPAVAAEPAPPQSFDDLVANSVSAITDSPVVQVVMERSVGPGAQNDYSSSAGTIIDRVSGLRRTVVELSGEGWNGLATRNDLARLRTNDTYQFLFSSEQAYIKASPALRSLPAGSSWLTNSLAAFEDEQRTHFEAVVITDPNDMIADVVALLQLDVEPIETGPSTYRLDVPNGDLLRLSPGSGVLSLVALDHVRNQGADAAAFTETSPVRLSFEGGVLASISVDLAPIFDELPAVAGTNAFDGIEIDEVYTVGYGTEAVLSLPDADDVVDPTDLIRDRETVGTCLERDDEAGVYVDISCVEPHVWEVVQTGRYDDAFGVAFPGATTLLERTSPECNEKVESLLSLSLVQTDLVVDVRTPSEMLWEKGDRQYACVVKFPDPVEAPLSELDLEVFKGKVTRFEIQVGSCIESEGLEVLNFGTVDCAEPHFYEVYLRVPVKDVFGTYPGEEAVLEQANQECVDYIEARVTVGNLRLEWQVQALVPSVGTWNEYNDRDIVCLATTEQLESGRQFTEAPPAPAAPEEPPVGE